MDISKKFSNSDCNQKFIKNSPKSKVSKSQSQSYLTQNVSRTSNQNNERKTKPFTPKNNTKLPIVNCSVCYKEKHIIYDCPEFLLMTSHQRYNKIKELNYCINCLRPHSIKTCNSQRRMQDLQ